MRIDLSSLIDETVSSIPFNGEIDKSSIDINGRKIKFTNPIKYDGQIYNVDNDKILNVNIDYFYKEACGRCLDDFKNKGTTVLSAKLVKKTEDYNGDEDEEVIFYSEEKLDLTDDIMVEIILSLPMKPLCSEDCKGMCPQCGTNLNKEDCDCLVEDIDPRFEILKDISIED